MLWPVKKRPEGGAPNSGPRWTPYYLPPDRHAVARRDHVGHGGLDVPDTVPDPRNMLAEAFPPGHAGGFVDGVLGDELIEQLHPVLADHLGEEPPSGVFVDAGIHVAARSRGSRMPALALSPPSMGVDTARSQAWSSALAPVRDRGEAGQRRAPGSSRSSCSYQHGSMITV